MDSASICTFIEESRLIARQQLTRWDGVDPTRLLQACDIIEQLLAEPPRLAHLPPGAASGYAAIIDPCVLVGLNGARLVQPYSPYHVEWTLSTDVVSVGVALQLTRDLASFVATQLRVLLQVLP